MSKSCTPQNTPHDIKALRIHLSTAQRDVAQALAAIESLKRCLDTTTADASRVHFGILDIAEQTTKHLVALDHWASRPWYTRLFTAPKLNA